MYIKMIRVKPVSNRYGKVNEVGYLNAHDERVHHYRAIISILYEANERYEKAYSVLDITAALNKEYPHAEYDETEVKGYLTFLEKSGNLETEVNKDTHYSLVDFIHNKKSYFISQSTVEIERLVRRLDAETKKSLLIHEENLHKMATLIRESATIATLNPEDKEEGRRILKWWEDLLHLFNDLQLKAVDSSHLYQAKIETLLRDLEAFEVYKYKILSLLGEFTSVLMEILQDVEAAMEIYEVHREELPTLIVRAQEKLEVSFLGADHDVEVEKLNMIMLNHSRWFQGGKHSDFGFQKVLENSRTLASNLIRIINDRNKRAMNSANRSHELIHMAKVFKRLAHKNEAHEVFAKIFGATKTQSLKSEEKHIIGAFDSPYEEKPTVYKYIHKDRKRRKKETSRSHLNTAECEATIYEAEQEFCRMRDCLKALIVDDVIDFGEIDELPLEVLNLLVDYGSKLMQENESVATEFGFVLKLKSVDEEVMSQIKSGEKVYITPKIVMEVESYA